MRRFNRGMTTEYHKEQFEIIEDECDEEEYLLYDDIKEFREYHWEKMFYKYENRYYKEEMMGIVDKY